MTPIKGYEKLYAVTQDGRVFSYPRNWISSGGAKRSHNGIWLKLHQDNRGYLHVRLRKDNRHKNFLVSRLVAQAFIPNPLNLPQVNHIDGNKLNNHVLNLEWCTNGENQKHAYSLGLRKRLTGELNGRWKGLRNENPKIPSR